MTADAVLTASSPAKLNLFLHITGRRPDGYHDLQTLFQFIDLSDTMHFKVREDDSINLQFPDKSVPNEDNLIVRAARALQRATGSRRGADIDIEKRIPMGGGLGGGSSNAATTLATLNRLWQTGLDRRQLCDIGVTLGADVPIFIHGHAAIARGVGEIFDDVDLEEPWYLLVIPDCHVPTAKLFQEKQLTRDSKLITLCDFLNGKGHNDFEPVARALFPAVETAFQLLNKVGNAHLTGTGACMFASFPSRILAEEAAKQLGLIIDSSPAGNISWRVTQGKNTSPLYEKAN